MLSGLSALPIAAAASAVAVDIRAVGPITAQADRADYEASIADCTRLVEAEVRAGEFQQTLAAADAKRSESSVLGCSFVFSGSGAGRLDPNLSLRFNDGGTQNHAEH